jgi:23S rRNA (cytosine1962-C5)-methyltransferase
VEDGISFSIETLAGQKTAWYFDQRPARDLLAPLCEGRRVLDLYCYVGGFALRAASHKADSAVGIDSSAPAIAHAAQAAVASGLAEKCSFVRGEVFAELEARAKSRERFDIVICDPPAFVKSRKTLAQGLRGYRKLARLAARLVTPGGLLFTASCSHLADPVSFAVEVRQGVSAADRSARILASGGAGPDHPVHPQLPESAYLKWQLLMLD